jgi:hypothetical protein
VFYLAVCDARSKRTNPNDYGIFDQLVFCGDKSSFVKGFQGRIKTTLKRKGIPISWLIKELWYPDKEKDKIILDANGKERRHWKQHQKPEYFVKLSFLENLGQACFRALNQKSVEEDRLKSFTSAFRFLAITCHTLDFLNKDNPEISLRKNDFKKAISRFDEYVSFVIENISAS